MRTVALIRTDRIRERLFAIGSSAGLQFVAFAATFAQFVDAASHERPMCLCMELSDPADVRGLEGAAAGRPVATVVIADDAAMSQVERTATRLVLSRRLILREDAQAQRHMLDRITNFVERQAAMSRWTRSSEDLDRELGELDGLDADDL